MHPNNLFDLAVTYHSWMHDSDSGADSANRALVHGRDKHPARVT